MDRKYIVLVPLAALIIACTTCSTSTTLPQPSTESAATEAVATEAPANTVSGGDILLYSDEGGEAGSQLDSFPTTQRVLHFKTKVDPVNTGQKVRWVFTALLAGDLKNEQISELKLDVPQDNVTTLSASLSNDTDWPSGTYKADLYVDDVLLKSGEFLIAEQQ